MKTGVLTKEKLEELDLGCVAAELGSYIKGAKKPFWLGSSRPHNRVIHPRAKVRLRALARLRVIARGIIWLFHVNHNIYDIGLVGNKCFSREVGIAHGRALIHP